jgi:hypothetical protein
MSTDLTQVLIWIMGMGGPAIVAYIFALVAENIPGWSTLNHNLKVIIPMFVSIALAIGASILLKYPAIISEIQPYFQVAVAAALAYLASQKSYMTAMRAQYGSRFAHPDSRKPLQIEARQ